MYCIVFVILCVVYSLSVCVLFCVYLCIVVPLPWGANPFAVNNSGGGGGGGGNSEWKRDK